MTIKHKKTSAAGPSSDPAKVGGDDWNDDHLVDASGIPMTGSDTAPATPTSGQMQFWAANIGTTQMPAFLTADGVFPLQPFLGRRAVAMWIPRVSASTPDQLGVSYTALPVAQNGTLDYTSFFRSFRRVGASSNATAGTVARLTSGSAVAARGTVAGTGGFRLVLRYGCADAAAVTGARSFVGLSQTQFNNVDPSTATNVIGVGSDGGDTTLSIFTNDASGSATKIALGANFPDHTLGVDVYELVLYAPPAATWIGVDITRLNTGHRYHTVLTTDLPQSSTAMQILLQRNNNAQALSVQLFCMGMYLETEG